MVALALMLQLLKLYITGFAVTAQESNGSIISPSPAFFPVIPPRVGTLGPIYHGEGSKAPNVPPDGDGFVISSSPASLHVYLSPSSPTMPNDFNDPGPFLQPPKTFPPPTAAPTPQKIKDIEPFKSPSPSSIALSPPYEVVPSPSAVQGNKPPSVNTSPPQMKVPSVRPPVSTPTAPAPIAVNLTKESPVSQPPEHGVLAPIVHQRNASMGHNLEPAQPASVAIPPTTHKLKTMDREPTQHGSIPPNVHKSITNKGHTSEPVSPESVASPPRKVENNPPEAHPIVPTTTPSILPVASPTPLRSINWKKGGAPVVAPLSRNPKPFPAVIHSHAQAPAAQNAWQLHHAPEPLISPPKSPSNKEYHSPMMSPSTSFYKHPRTGEAIPPLLPPSSGQRHHAPPPMNSSSSISTSVSPLSSPIHSHMDQVSPANSPSIKFAPPPTRIPPSESSSKRPKMPILPQVQALPPPPPNEDCLSTVCTEPYTNSPPGEPCRCVWPMRIGLRLSVSLYTFFPLVSELASEIATGVFMKQSQVRIMGANAADQQPEKTVVLIDLVPLGGEFDNTTAFLTSDRFWHKKVLIKAFYFGDYDVLYVTYPGLPPSPPLRPSSLNIFDGGPYSTNGSNGGKIKPFGVDIQKKHHKGGLSRGIIAIIAVTVSLAVVLCASAAWFMIKFRDHVNQPVSTPRQLLPPSLTKEPGTAGSLRSGGVGSVSTSFRSSIAAYTGFAKTFGMNDIVKATDNFHVSRILGEGGFGRVYSGILEDGMEVAVKVLKREDHHGDREFLAEVEMLSRLHHRNLVKLVGICTEDSFRCLVYELIPNGSVESHLHGVDRENSPLDWGALMKIALGAARGLAYLHEDSSPRVIHRDFKSSNILLEGDFTPKVSDFGLARTATDEENKHISTRVMGTFGYVAPEYAMTGHLLVKSDVYSYGVVLLELLTGRKPIDMSQSPGQENLVAWARPLLTSKEGLDAMIDPSLGADVPFDSVAKVAAIASMCVQPEVSNRPFMGEVVQALKLVCNECDEAKEETGSRSSSQEDLSVDLDLGISTVSGQPPDNFQSQFSPTNFDSGVDIERGLAASELFSSSARFGRVESGSFRRNSYSGPLRTGRSQKLWQIIRSLSSGSGSEHGTMLKL
ncbi:receptor-like serine/threonine-protein kinase ALE2 isoform X2 [Cajanus cajan]|nr:receptor-like serine/threonine-protein kinase ALE2 isoform X2 [Cajanus cajan]